MKALIFGANGQDGFYLGELLRQNNVETIGAARSGGDLTGDVADFGFVETAIKNLKPEYVFHLAANSTTRHEAIFENHQAIATGAINILEAAYRHSPASRIFLAGSAMQFQNDGLPINENTAFAAVSPYAVSRIHSIYAGRYFRSLGLKVYAGYFFNHDSPLRAAAHVNQKIALAAKRIGAGANEKIEIGDITVKKEFNFAGDIVEAVWLLINQNKIYEAVIGSGEAHSIEDWLEVCFRRINKNWRDYVVIKNGYRAEYEVLISDPRLIKSLGWRPRTSFAELAAMMMEESRESRVESREEEI